MPFGNDLAVHAQPRNAAIGINVKAQMRERVGILDVEEILAVAFELRFRHDLEPLRFEERVGVRLRLERARLERAVRGKIAAKVARVDEHAPNDARNAEPDDGEIVPRSSFAAAFPAVHPLTAIGIHALFPVRLRSLQQILFRREKIVRRVKHGTAEALGGEID